MPLARPDLRRPSRAVLGAALLLTCVVGPIRFAPLARADDAPPAPVAPAPVAPAPVAPAPAGPTPGGRTPSAEARLSPDELAFLRRRVPDFDRRDVADRERLARNLLRLRSLSPFERERLLARVKRVEADDGPGASAAAARLRRLPDDRRPWLEGARRARAAASAIVAALPAAARETVTPGAGPRSIGAGERLALDVCLASAWKRRVLDGLLARPPVDAEPSAGSPQATAFVQARDRVRAGGFAGGVSGASIDERRALALAYVEDRVGSARRSVAPAPAPASPGDPTITPSRGEGDGAPAVRRLEAFSVALDAAFPGVAAAVAADLARALESGVPALRAFCDDAMPDRSPRREALASLVFGLERARPVLSGEPLAKASALQVALLRELKVSDGEIAAFEAAPDEKARLLVLAPLRRRFPAMERGPHAEAWPGRGERPFGGRRGLPKPADDGAGGKSADDADGGR